MEFINLETKIKAKILIWSVKYPENNTILMIAHFNPREYLTKEFISLLDAMIKEDSISQIDRTHAFVLSMQINEYLQSTHGMFYTQRYSSHRKHS
jgi:hypothetical protein